MDFCKHIYTHSDLNNVGWLLVLSDSIIINTVNVNTIISLFGV